MIILLKEMIDFNKILFYNIKITPDLLYLFFKMNIDSENGAWKDYRRNTGIVWQMIHYNICDLVLSCCIFTSIRKFRAHFRMDMEPYDGGSCYNRSNFWFLVKKTKWPPAFSSDFLSIVLGKIY
jgi:hypothetical protein